MMTDKSNGSRGDGDQEKGRMLSSDVGMKVQHPYTAPRARGTESREL